MNKSKMYKTLTLFLLVNTCSFGQLSKECFDKNGMPSDEQNGEYCVVGKRVLRVDELPLGRTDTVESYIDTVTAYYTSIKRIKYIKIYNKNGFLNGSFIEYFPNGKIKERGSYREGSKLGYFTNFYPDGKTKSTLQYFPKDERVSNWNGIDFKIINYWDSTRNQIVTKGNGHCNCVLESGRKEIGKVVDGLRDSVWVEYLNDTLILRETYSKGKFLEGIRYYEGKEYKYKDFEQPPEFKGGLEAMYKFLSKNLRYPAEARRMQIEGSVFIGFVVAKDGTVQDIEIIKGISIDCDKEAWRVASLFPKWVPALQRGEPVNVKFVLPLKFKLD